MKVMSYICLVVILSAGCTQKPAPTSGLLPPQSTVISTPGATNPDSWTAVQPPTEPALEVVIPPEEKWALKLSDKNPALRSQAKHELANLGEQGFPVFLKGLKDKRPEVRKSCVEGIYRGQLVDHKKETLPILEIMLEADELPIRNAAAQRLGEFGVIYVKASTLGAKPEDPLTEGEMKRIIDKLRRVADTLDEDIGLRRAALLSAQTLEQLYYGEVVNGVFRKKIMQRQAVDPGKPVYVPFPEVMPN